MSGETISQEFWLKNIDETKHYLIEFINQNKKPKVARTKNRRIMLL